ncbi:acetylornithine aminotransferase [Candidatus Uzinura diaspidicola str. ASNER]|uniref:Acetylornithine aminotransferase n=1 Tax=Candidatus Uzinura diaspidicola str. ASNER TaxID=1133592 RepID=L7VKG4_9FLAO|nr:acetylornithine aminotransferase [Candidatus Uzinura diaspidicola str. ASNER]
MYLFEVYPTFSLNLERGYSTFLFDKKGNSYLDFYGGHAVISIGHSHPGWINTLKKQLSKIGFYSNVIESTKQKVLSEQLGYFSGYEDYQLFLCNSGAEAIENALKIASFHKEKKKVVAFKGSFHGRTSAALSITDNTKIITRINDTHSRIFLEHGDELSLISELEAGEVCAVISEGIQGVAGIVSPGVDFLKKLAKNCNRYKVPLILDEIQSGYGRSGYFFAHQAASIRPDLITIAKGMGNGFPIAGVLISPQFKAFYGMLGTTFGGNYLSCVAALAVLEVIKKEEIIENVRSIGFIAIEYLKKMPQIKNISGCGLILGIHFEFPVFSLKESLLYNENVFVGTANNALILRLLPPLNISIKEIQFFIDKLQNALANIENDLLST